MTVNEQVKVIYVFSKVAPELLLLTTPRVVGLNAPHNCK